MAIAIGVAVVQFYLAKFSSSRSLLEASIIALGALAVIAGYGLFLLRAKVAISDAEVAVYDLHGRERFRAARADVSLRLVAVNDLGIHDEFGVLWAKPTNGTTSAVLLRRVAWGDGALSALRVRLEGRHGALNFRRVSKGDLSGEFPRLYTQNLPAIAVVVVVVLVLAIVISR